MLIFQTKMVEESYPGIICLGNIFDQDCHERGGEKIERCLEMASGREVIVLCSPPKAPQRRSARRLPSLETKFATRRQLSSANRDVPGLRVSLSWIFHARHILCTFVPVHTVG